MLMRPLVKPLLAAAALAALAAVYSSSPAAADPTSCAAYARDVAASEAPRRGIIDGLVIGTLDTVFTGGAGADERYRDAYDDAYARCIQDERVAYVEQPREHVVVTVPEEDSDEWITYCTAKYHTFDPDTGMYVTYSGEYVRCR